MWPMPTPRLPLKIFGKFIEGVLENKDLLDGAFINFKIFDQSHPSTITNVSLWFGLC